MEIRTRRLGLLATVLTLALAGTPVAGATPPGRNGAIAFKRYLDDAHSSSALFTIRPDGTGERQVTRPVGGALDDQPDWSRNGARIVFTRGGTSDSVWTVRPDGTDIRRVTPPCASVSCEDASGGSFAPNGRRVVFTRATGGVRTIGDDTWINHSDIATRKLDGSGLQTIVHGRPYHGDNVEPAFAPDGRRLVYLQVNSPLARPADGRALIVVRANGTHRRRITPWSLGAGDNPDWSPDGKLIVFRSHEEGPEQSQIMVVHPDGSGLRALTHFPDDTTVLSYSFSPNGRSITFAKEGEDGEPDVWVMRRDGSGMRQVTRTSLWDSAPDWGPAR